MTDPKLKQQFTVAVYTAPDVEGMRGAIMATKDRYLILINEDQTPAEQLASFLHEMTHVYNRDFESTDDAGTIEARTHEQLRAALKVLQKQDKAGSFAES